MCGHGCASCTPAARRGGSLNFACGNRCRPVVVRTRQPIGWESQRRHRRAAPQAPPPHPGSPPGWGVSTIARTMSATPRGCTPAARRVGVSTRPTAGTGTACPTCTGSPPGVGVSTSSGGVGIESSRRAPRQPAGVGVQRRRGARIQEPHLRAPAARRGGSLNRMNTPSGSSVTRRWLQRGRIVCALRVPSGAQDDVEDVALSGGRRTGGT